LRKAFTVTPEGAFLWNENNHAKAVKKYKFAIIDGGKKDPDQMDIVDYT